MTKGFGWGLVLGAFLFVSCASALKYPYFGMGISAECFDSSKLLGVNGNGDFDPDLDEPMKVCENYACVVSRIEVRERLETDLLTCQESLDACESQ